MFYLREYIKYATKSEQNRTKIYKTVTIGAHPCVRPANRIKGNK